MKDQTWTLMLLGLIRHIQLLGQTLMFLFSILFSLESSYTMQCKGNGLKSEVGIPSPPAAEILCPSSLPPSLRLIWLLPKRFF